jgi:predicted Zn-dependent peptidase
MRNAEIILAATWARSLLSCTGTGQTWQGRICGRTVSPDDLIGQLHFVDSQGLDRSFLSSYVQKVMAVTPQGVAETYIVPSKMTIVVVGDKSKIAEQLKPYQSAP